MTTWFISDTHFGEQPKRRIIQSRMSGHELDRLIEKNWRATVCETDTIWHLGDIGRNWRLLCSLPGKKHLVLAHRADRSAAIRNSSIFESIHETCTLYSPIGDLFLIHNPDELLDQSIGNVVHGHHHYKPPLSGHRSVCVDHANWGPISFDELTRGEQADLQAGSSFHQEEAHAPIRSET